LLLYGLAPAIAPAWAGAPCRPPTPPMRRGKVGNFCRDPAAGADWPPLQPPVVGPQPTEITSVSRGTPLACRLQRVARSIRTERSSVPRVQSHIGVHTPHLPPGSRSNLPSAEADGRASPFALLVDEKSEPAREATERTSGPVARAATGGSRQDLGPHPKARAAEQDRGAEVQSRNAPKVA